MNKRDLLEEEMEDMIRKEGEKLSIPERLQPEAVRQKLLGQKKPSIVRRRRQIRRWGMAAAMLCLVCGCGVAWSMTGMRAEQEGSGKSAEMRREEAAGKTAQEKSAGETEEALVYAESYEEVRNTLRQIAKRSRVQKEADLLDQEEVSGEEVYGEALYEQYEGVSGQTAKGIVHESESDDSLSSSSGHSETNVMVEGILEADQANTDGKYLYRLRSAENGYCLDIVKADGGKMKSVGKYQIKNNISPKEFFVAEDQLIVLSNATRKGTSCTLITFLDITDRENPVKRGELTQSGFYSQSRLQDGYLYIVSGNRQSDCYVGEEEEAATIPCLNGKKIKASKIYIPEGCDTTEFTTITSVSLKDSEDFTDSRSIVTSSDYLHMTEDSIYLTNAKWMDLKKQKEAVDATQITKFSYEKGNFAGKATGQVDGSVQDAFAVNEYQGNLRVITSVTHRDTKEDNAVYVLDENLKIIGSIEELAKDERVYSARFQGDIGYFVTYRETDPLFSVDFSNPKKPKILGKLKIPGFSEYMHFYNDHLLFGLGLEESKDGGEQVVKLSMFDISDPTNVKEIHKKLLKGVSYSQALYNYKAVLIDPEKNIIGFDGSIEQGWDEVVSYFVYSYDEEKGFVRKIQEKKVTDWDSEDPGDWLPRGLYIGDTVYLADLHSHAIEAYDLGSGKQIGKYDK